MDRLKEDFGQTWRWLAEGWRAISQKAAQALTYFQPAQDDETGSGASMRWGLLAADVTDRGSNVVVELEAPGLDKGDFDITVEARRLMVSGSKRFETERREGTMHITERAFGHFQRVIPMPEEVTAEGAGARYERGVLTVTVPKARPPERRKIAVVVG